MTKRKCFIIGGFIVFSVFTVSVAEDSGSTEKIKVLIEAINQAHVPCEAMRFEFSEESRGGRVIRKVPGQVIPEQPPYTKYRYKVAVKGTRSRIECIQETYPAEEAKESTEVLHSTFVFDGTKQRKLMKRPKATITDPLGWQYLRDKNTQLIRKKVYGCPIDFARMDFFSYYKCELEENPDSALYILKVTKPNGGYYRVTVDSAKGFSISKIENIVNNDRLDYRATASKFFVIQEIANGSPITSV